MSHEFWQKIMIHDGHFVKKENEWGEIEWSPVLRHQIQTGCLFHNVFIIISFCIATVHSLFCPLLFGQNDENHYFDIFPLSS